MKVVARKATRAAVTAGAGDTAGAIPAAITISMGRMVCMPAAAMLMVPIAARKMRIKTTNAPTNVTIIMIAAMPFFIVHTTTKIAAAGVVT
jgi:hypothetical protein